MPIERVPRKEPLTKAEFHSRLWEWLDTTDEEIVGSANVDARKGWVHVTDGGRVYELHPDTRRSAISWYLDRVAIHGDGIQWIVVPTQKGKLRAVVHGPKEERLKSLYLYLVN